MASRPAARPVSLVEIVAALGGELHGASGVMVDAIRPLETAGEGHICFLAQTRLRSVLETVHPSAVIVRPDLLDLALTRARAVIVSPDPYRYYGALTRWWADRIRIPAIPGVHASAVIGQGVHLGRGVSIGPLAVIEDGAALEDGVCIGAQAWVGAHARLGEYSRLAPQVQFGAACILGARGILHGGVVVGADGFGFAPAGGRWEKIEQLGAVRIGDDVEIGANTCIDRGALDDTVIEDGVKLDNLIQIAHNVHIGAHTAMAGCVGVAGSARIGAQCTVGGAAMILGHLQIADHVHISAASVVMSSILRPGQYSGVFPIDENGNWEKNAATLRQLHTLRSRLRAVEKKITP